MIWICVRDREFREYVEKRCEADAVAESVQLLDRRLKTVSCRLRLTKIDVCLPEAAQNHRFSPHVADLTGEGESLCEQVSGTLGVSTRGLDDSEVAERACAADRVFGLNRQRACSL